MIFLLSKFLSDYKILDLIVSLLRGKNAAVKANKMALPAKWSRKVLTFLRMVSTYF